MPSGSPTREILRLIMFATSMQCGQIAAQLEDVRVFTTPVERERLDSERYGGKKSERAGMETTLPATPKTIELQGVVMRSNGSHAVWVNDSNALSCDRAMGELRMRTGKAGIVQVEFADGKTVILVPGQSYDQLSGETTGIRVRRSR